MNLKDLQSTAAECELCGLCKGRNKPVFARGDPSSKIVVCGMCPGPDENKAGIPFVGAAGQILDAILVGAFGDNDSVYITNLVKCFVAPGTKLDNHWMNTCLPYFLVQLKLIQPKVIIALGKDVCNFLLNNEDNMGNMRGNVYDYMGTKLIGSYHPAFLARGNQKRFFSTVVEDFELALKFI